MRRIEAAHPQNKKKYSHLHLPNCKYFFLRILETYLQIVNMKNADDDVF